MQKIQSTTKSTAIIDFIACVGLVIILGFITGLISGATMGYTSFVRPPITPPDVVFAIVWPILYFMIGLSLFFAVRAYRNFKVDKITFGWYITFFVIQLALNLFWPYIFFTFSMPIISAVVIALLDGAVLALIICSFSRLRTSSLLLLPYFAWLLFATYLNVYIAIMN